MKYSQHNEEELIEKYLGDVEKGKYIDIGGGESKNLSNTYGLYLKGWRGIVLEPLGPFYEMHVKDRPKDINLKMAVSNYDGEIEMCDSATVGSFIGDDYVKVGTPKGKRYPIRKEKCITINTLIEKYPEYAKPDFCTIDVETNEDKVLAGADFIKFTPTVMIIEHMVRGVDYRSNWMHFINPYYDLVETIIGNLMFLRKEGI